MKSRISTLAALLCLSSFTLAEAQSVQQGQVLLYHGREAKTPLAGVSVSASNAGSVISDAEGLFTLQFRTLKVGDPIQFRRIDLNGYEVMNTEALEVARIAAQSDNGGTSDNRLTIVLCSSEELANLRDGYHTQAAERYKQQLDKAQQEVEQLKQEGKIREEEYNQRMDDLEEQFNQQLQTLDTYVDKFARIDLSELDAFEQEIIALVQEGRFDEAIARYDDQHLTERLQQGIAEQRQLNNDLQMLDAAIEAKEEEASRLEKNIDKQIELLRKVGGEENERKIEELRKAKE